MKILFDMPLPSLVLEHHWSLDGETSCHVKDNMKLSPQKGKNLAHKFDANNAPLGPLLSRVQNNGEILDGNNTRAIVLGF